MSVTFQIESLPLDTFRVVCASTETPLTLHAPLDIARTLLARHQTGCEDCTYYGHVEAEWDVSDALDVNVSNVNAHTLLGALGVAYDPEDGLCGRLTAEDFLGRVLVALASDRDDSGVASAVIGGAPLGQRGATMIDCGLPAGYFAGRFGQLHALALEAIRLGRDVCWS